MQKFEQLLSAYKIKMNQQNIEESNSIATPDEFTPPQDPSQKNDEDINVGSKTSAQFNKTALTSQSHPRQAT